MIKRLPIVITTILTTLFMNACGQAAPPTLSVLDIQNTGVALAWTGLAMTQAALPSSTPPPTQTEMATLAPFPTLASGIPTPGLLIPASSPTADTCSQPIPPKVTGTQVELKFLNKSGGSVNLAFGMNSPNSDGECGTYSFSFGQYDSPTVNVLAGCYWGYGWVTGQKPSTTRTAGSICLTAGEGPFVVTVGNEVIALKP